MRKGKFIVIEGINGCGKGTHLSKLTDFVYDLDKANTIFRTREPNNFDDNGKKARALLKQDGDPYSNNVAAVGYFAENRKAHNEIFVPMLDKGIDVFSDRYWYSNFAFQGAQGIPYEDIARTNKGLRVPDLTILIDVPVDVVFDRLEKRDGLSRRKFDSDKGFVSKVRANYLEFPEVLPGLMGDESIVVVNGNQSIEAVFEEVKSAYLSF
jgi:dTMP kinase